MTKQPALMLLVATLGAPPLSGCFTIGGTILSLTKRGPHVSPDSYAQIEAGTTVTFLDRHGLRLTGTFVGVDSSGGTSVRLRTMVGARTSRFATDEVSDMRLVGMPYLRYGIPLGIAADLLAFGALAALFDSAIPD